MSIKVSVARHINPVAINTLHEEIELKLTATISVLVGFEFVL